MTPSANRIEPFKGLIYNRDRCGDLRDVIAPPYDLIDDAAQQRLYDRSPYNVVRVELAREPDRYRAGQETLKAWRQDGILLPHPEPALYLYTQKFEAAGRTLTRQAIIARFKLEPFARGRILPHEKTFPKAKEDRLRLLEATATNISPIFGLYSGRHPDLDALIKEVFSREPLIAVADDAGIRNEIRPITAVGEIAVVQTEIADAQVLIADGHHRYETALEYRRRMRAVDGDLSAARPYDYVMMGLVSCDDPGLVILATHRVARQLDAHARSGFARWAGEMFDIETYSDRAAFLSRLAQCRSGVIGVSLHGDPTLRILRMRNMEDTMATLAPDSPPELRLLDVTILHCAILERAFAIDADIVRAGATIAYTIDADAALDSVAEGTADGAFLINPPSIREVEGASQAGVTMPEKSTYFFPKLATGFVLNPLD